MASRRRRRHGDDDSEDLSEHGSPENEKQDNVNRIHDDHLSEDLELSEYESMDDESEDYATSDSDDEAPVAPPEPTKKESEEEEVKEVHQPDEDPEVDEEPKKIQILPNAKRESGDGKEESEKEHSPERNANDKKLNFKQEEEENEVEEKDENPAFTPRAGAFFQHDMRTDETSKNFRPRYNQRESKKWTHDCFILEEQMPKTNTDIIEEYGFDLRKQKGEEILNKPKQSRNRNRPPRGGHGPPQRGRGNYSRRGNTTFKQQPRQERANVPPPQSSNRQNTRPQRRNRRQSTEKPDDDSTRTRPTEQKDVKNVQQPDQIKVSVESKSQESKPEAPKGEKEFSSLLNVINKQEKTPKQDKPQSSGHPPQMVSNHSKMEARRPKRYSSLRQNTGTGSGDATTTRGWRKSENAPKYQSNFSNPNVQNPRFNQKKDVLENTSVQQQPSPTHAVTQPSVTTTTPPIANEYSSQPDLTSVAMTMPYPPNPQFTHPHHQYYHNPAYQQLCQQMNDQLMVEQRLSNIPPPQTDGQTPGVPPEHLNPLLNAPGIPSHSQGVTSLLPQPQPMHLPTPYFSSPVPSSVMPQMPMGYPPNLIGQQVGGVTYFNTPSPPTLPQQQVTTNQLSPARRPTSAIPIKSPESTQFGLPLTGVE